MSTRRSHPKSRRGCITCKNRHVKCDEKGPPCGRCQTRGTKCQYASPSTQPAEPLPAELTPESPKSDIPTAGDFTRRGEVRYPATRQLLELQLMHRWSALTYKSCCTPGSDDDEVWQYMVPSLAIQHDYLIYGIFALSAFETAKMTDTPDRQMYINTAMEYHSLALKQFQSQLPSISSETHEAALCMSLMLVTLALASAQVSPSWEDGEKGRMAHAVVTHSELLRGCLPVLNIEEGYISRNVHIRKLKRFEDLPRTPMGSDLNAAFVQLSDLNDRRITMSVRDSDDRRVQQVEYWESCKKALVVLQECYEKCVDDLSRGYALGWPNMAGDGYIKAIEERDDVALLILMYWGVLVHTLAHQVWWAEDFGSLLVAEIAKDVVLNENDAQHRDIITRAQSQVKKLQS